MRRFPPAGLVVPWLVLASVAAARAQSLTTAMPYLARDGGLPSNPFLAGIALAEREGPIGMRLSGAVGDPLTSAHGTSGLPLGPRFAWSGDVDVLLSAPGGGSGSLTPTLFAGAGVHGVERADGTRESAPIWNAGAALELSILPALSLEGEARYRMPLADSAAIPAGFSRGWEYRVGLTFRFGHPQGQVAADRPTFITRRRGSVVHPVLSTSAGAVLGEAEAYLGTPYRYGGTTPAGFDCSGFVQYVYGREGILLPRTSRQMAGVGDGVEGALATLAPGDLMLFASNGDRIDHVAIYAGHERIIHATASGDGVRYDDLATPRGAWFVRHMVAARRVIGRPSNSTRHRANAFAGTPDSLDPPDHAPRP
ncbi:MAG: hypothetical protein NVS4B3_15760 [Gemmatimonadaceae bacterium]